MKRFTIELTEREMELVQVALMERISALRDDIETAEDEALLVRNEILFDRILEEQLK